MKTTLGLTLLLFATLFSCMRQEKPLPAELSRAESVMWEHPDSALLCLSSLDSSIMNEPENIRMYHALLKIKAKDKLYIPHKSDSLIKSIVQYYEDYGTPDQLMEAYYYLAYIIHSGFISGYQNRYGDNLKPPTNVYHRMTA